MSEENLIAMIDSETGLSGLRIIRVVTDDEWNVYHRIRKQQIFDLVEIEYDTNHYTLKDKAHVHLVLYKDTDIVGVAQLEYLGANEVALRPFAIDAPYQNQGFGSLFLVNIEKWLRQQKCHILRLHANPQAVIFYERLGYTRMPFHEDGRSVDVEYVDMGKILSL